MPVPRLAGPFLVVVLALSSVLAGCVGNRGPWRPQGDFALEQQKVFIADNATEAPASASPLPETRAWHVGDLWYWESNGTNYQEMFVLGIGEPSSGPLKGRLLYDVSQVSGVIGGPVLASARLTVDAHTFGIVNETVTGGRVVFSPENPSIRFLHDGVFFYNESGAIYTSAGNSAWVDHYIVRVDRREDRPLALPAGHFNTSHFRVYTTEYGTTQQGTQFLFTERIWSPDVMNDVITITNTKEIFKLVFYRHDGVSHGFAPTWMTHG